MNYTTNEVAQKLGITKDTLFYYEREGLLPQIERDEMNRRIYSESDIEWIFLIRCLRDTDMPMCKIKQYISLLKHGGENSIPERKNILVEHEAFIIGKIKAYQDLLLLIKKKIEFYDEVLNDKNTESQQCMDYLMEWEHFKELLGGIAYEK